MRGKVSLKLNNKKSQSNDSTLQEPLARKPESLGSGSLNVIVLDAAQTKFNVKADATWTVAEFKRAGSAIHKVAPASQRLIHMGRLLQDSETLKDYGIDDHDKIVHLFPKPQVVLTSAASDEEERSASAPSSEHGAHVPQIVVDADEAGNRSQILILSSHEIFEAQHRIKLLSFFLFVICAMELLTLFTIMAGVPSSADESTKNQNGFGGGDIPPGDPTDTFNHHKTDAAQIRTWQNSDYFDLIISSLGLYVSTLGIKAATENTVTLAKQYFALLLVTGISWLGYYYYLDVCAEQKAFHEKNQDQLIPDSNIYTQALLGILLPGCVWGLCFFRAFQFTRLLEEAQQEAEERIDNMNINSATLDEEAPVTATTTDTNANTNTSIPNENDSLTDLQLRMESRIIT